MFVPADAVLPTRLTTPLFVLEPLGPEHNERDYEAWTSSIDHILGTPGFESWGWPHPMSLAENLADLEQHARDFETRAGFTFSVLDPVTDDVLGCVYVYPDRTGDTDASVRSWVRASRADLDVPLWRAVTDWLASDAWPLTRVAYKARTTGGE
jgi:hypothetical protein